MQKEKFITSEKLAELVKQSESSIIKLCEDGLINANFVNNQWLISENVELPCIKYLNEFDKMNQDNVNILNGLYEVVQSEELSRWFYGIYHDDEYCGALRLIISKGIYKDTTGKKHEKYVLSTEMSSWNVE